MQVLTTKRMARSWLKDVPNDKVLRCRDGLSVKNLAELYSVLRGMSEETFCYHVTMEKNDFSNWVRDTIGDITLAEQLQNASSKASAERKVELRLHWLKTK